MVRTNIKCLPQLQENSNTQFRLEFKDAQAFRPHGYFLSYPSTLLSTPPFPPVPHPSPSPHSLLPFRARRGTLPLTESHSAPNKSEFVPCYRNFGYNPSWSDNLAEPVYNQPQFPKKRNSAQTRGHKNKLKSKS